MARSARTRPKTGGLRRRQLRPPQSAERPLPGRESRSSSTPKRERFPSAPSTAPRSATRPSRVTSTTCWWRSCVAAMQRYINYSIDSSRLLAQLSRTRSMSTRSTGHESHACELQQGRGSALPGTEVPAGTAVVSTVRLTRSGPPRLAPADVSCGRRRGKPG
jgi:hypothetical protein